MTGFCHAGHGRGTAQYPERGDRGRDRRERLDVATIPNDRAAAAAPHHDRHRACSLGCLALANFSLIYIMTQGGPGNATNILPLYSYQQAFTYNNLAYGALIGNVMVVIATVFGVFYVRITARRRE